MPESPTELMVVSLPIGAVFAIFVPGTPGTPGTPGMLDFFGSLMGGLS